MKLKIDIGLYIGANPGHIGAGKGEGRVVQNQPFPTSEATQRMALAGG